MNMFLSLEHICPDLIDIEVEVDYDEYQGTTDRGSGHLNSEDPSEIDITKITILEDFEYVDMGVKYKLYKGDVIHFLDDKIEQQIYEKIERNS